ncbi:MAG: hypothetical protein M3Z01_02770 [Thermoproteota archaeon]|nr:hypothetical protein [Thermoproteota archaeon]
MKYESVIIVHLINVKFALPNTDEMKISLIHYAVQIVLKQARRKYNLFL